jgi:hypothetical protein
MGSAANSGRTDPLTYVAVVASGVAGVHAVANARIVASGGHLNLLLDEQSDPEEVTKHWRPASSLFPDNGSITTICLVMSMAIRPCTF